MASSKIGSSTTKTALHSSTQLFLVGLIAEVIALVMLAIAVFVSVGSPSTVLTVFLISIVLSIIASALAGIIALVGLFRFRRMTVWNVLLLMCSIVFSPVFWLGLLALV